MRNITMRVDRAFDYSQRKKHVGGKVSETEDRRQTEYARQPSYVTLANVDGLTVDTLRVIIPDDVFAKYNRSGLSLHEISAATISDVSRRPAGAGSLTPVVAMENCRDTFLTRCFGLPETGVFLKVFGKDTANISLLGNDLSKAKTPIELATDIPKDEVGIRN